MSKIIIVDENDNVIDYKEREEIKPSDIYRVSSLWIENPKGKVLLAQRALSKKHDPGKWGPAVAGTVEEDETYETNVIKEAEEELGLKNINPKEHSKRFNDGLHKFFSQRYISVLDLDSDELEIQKDEVTSVKWFDKAELKKLIIERPEMFVSSMPVYLQDLLK